MIVYKCKCGSVLKVDNSEASRAKKREWKGLHHRKYPDHGWTRSKARKEEA